MTTRALLAAALLTACHLAAADADFVYESYDGVTLGRVFLSQAERDWLDARRHARPAGTTKSGAKSDTGSANKASRAAGYMTGPDGRLRVWRHGDFVESASTAPGDMAFPGDVEVVQHAAEGMTGDEE